MEARLEHIHNCNIMSINIFNSDIYSTGTTNILQDFCWVGVCVSFLGRFEWDTSHLNPSSAARSLCKEKWPSFSSARFITSNLVSSVPSSYVLVYAGMMVVMMMRRTTTTTQMMLLMIDVAIMLML